MSERKLATIQVVKALFPITGADMIEACQINGWVVVVKKGEYNVGDMVVYCEIDSWIPNTVAPFLTAEGKEPKEYEGVKGERLKTIKLRKQISQGLVLPMSVFRNFKATVFAEGVDVTENLGILKWEAPEEKQPVNRMQGSSTRSFPSFLVKTDQERIQNYGNLVLTALDEEFEATMKKDGSSMTVFRVNPNSAHYAAAKALYKKKLTLWQKIKAFFKKDEEKPVYGICSRNVLLPLEGDSNFHKAAKTTLEMLAGFNEGSVAIQGEVVAPDIQGNYEKVKDVEFHIFDVFDIDRQEYKLPAERQSFLGVMYAPVGVPHITVLGKDTLRNLLNLSDTATVDDVVRNALTFASGPGDNPGVMREGVVFKSAVRDFSFKAISNEYLLKKG